AHTIHKLEEGVALPSPSLSDPGAMVEAILAVLQQKDQASREKQLANLADDLRRLAPPDRKLVLFKLRERVKTVVRTIESDAAIPFDSDSLLWLATKLEHEPFSIEHEPF